MSEKKFYYKFACIDHPGIHAWDKDKFAVIKCNVCKTPMLLTNEKNEIKSKTNEEIIAMQKRNDFKRKHPPRWVCAR